MIENAGTHGHARPENASDHTGHRVFVSLGSNVGDRLMYLREASHRLGAHLTRLQASSVYETEPMYLSNQPAFLNAVLTGYFVGSPHELLEISNTIEAELGRDRQLEVPKGPRSLDIDLLLFGDLVLQSVDLKIPHPGLLERAFVLRPLLEIAPKLTHPQHKIPIAKLVQFDLSKGIYRQEQILL